MQIELPDEIKVFIRESTGNYGKVKLVLHRNKFFVESPFPDILRTLLKVGHKPTRTRLALAALFPGIGLAEANPPPGLLIT